MLDQAKLDSISNKIHQLNLNKYPYDVFIDQAAHYVIGGNKTSSFLARCLLSNRSVLFSWYGGPGAVYAVLLTLNPFFYGDVQHGLQRDYLYVSVMTVGAFGFHIDKENSLAGAYIEEKLKLPRLPADNMANLLNQVKISIMKTVEKGGE